MDQDLALGQNANRRNWHRTFKGKSVKGCFANLKTEAQNQTMFTKHLRYCKILNMEFSKYTIADL